MSDDTNPTKAPKGDGKGKGRRGRRPKDRHFMDAALDAYIRDRALTLWRDYVVYRERQEKPPKAALAETGFFEDRGAYAGVWNTHWESLVLPASGKSDGEIFGQIEAAVRASVMEERTARKAAGGETFEDTEDYNEFLRTTLNQLLEEATAP